jgi:hypothetical protein
MNRWMRATAVIATAGAVVAAGSEVANARPPVPVHSKTVHPVTAPDSMRPGLVHLRNTGSQELVLFRKIHLGVTTLVRDVNEEQRPTSGVPRLYRQFHAVAMIEGRSDAYVRLRRGTYYLFSGEVDRMHAADVHAITVSGGRDDARAPIARPITVQEHTNALIAPHRAHAGRWFHLSNQTHHTQEIVLFPVDPKVTWAQLHEFVAAPSLEKLFGLIDFRRFGTVAPLLTGPGEDLYVHAPKRTGRYIAADIALRGSEPTLRRHGAAVITVE